MLILDVVNPFAAPVYYEETVSSTMDVSRELAAKGLPGGTVIFADFQTAGRGRGSGGRRSWDMDRGNLAFTVLLRFGDTQAIPPALTLRAGLAVSLAVEDFIPALRGRALIKWPNDIMISSAGTAGADAKKAVGILAEADGGTVHIGIGINVAQTAFPDHLRDKATSLSIASGQVICSQARAGLLEKILARLYAEIEENAGGAACSGWRVRLEERLYKKGERVTFVEGRPDSGALVTGRLSGVGPLGELLITPDGADTPLPFFTGELRVY